MKKFLLLAITLPNALHSFSLGPAGGLVSPYGLGLELQQEFRRGTALSIGSGAFIDGLKLGAGAVQYFRTGNRLNPLAELYGSYSKGFGEVALKTNSNSEKNEYSFPSSWNAHVGGGVRWNIVSWLSLKWSLGYRLIWLSGDINLNGIKTGKVEDEFIDRLISPGIYLFGSCQLHL